MSNTEPAASSLTAAERIAAEPHRRDEGRSIRVLEVDRELGEWLPRERRKLAEAQLVGSVIALATGEWDVSSLEGTGRSAVGLLLGEGVVARELVLDTRVTIELFGPGDLLRPWEDAMSVLPISVRWNVLSPSRAIVLGAAFAARLRQFPEVNAALFARLHARGQRLAETQAISHGTNVEGRLHAMLWHLAGRWGRVTGDGIVVPLALSHRMLAEMVGAGRPTVSTALSELGRRGELARRSDGTWLLCGSAPPPRATTRRLVPPQSRRFEAEGTASLA